MFKIVQNGIKIYFSMFFYKISYLCLLHAVCTLVDYYSTCINRLKLIQLELILYQVIL